MIPVIRYYFWAVLIRVRRKRASRSPNNDAWVFFLQQVPGNRVVESIFRKPELSCDILECEDQRRVGPLGSGAVGEHVNPLDILTH